MEGDHDGDDERDGWVQPVEAAHGKDDGSADSNTGCCGGVGGGVEQNCSHVEVVTVVVIVDVATEDQGASEHYNGGDPADDEDGQATDWSGACR